MTLQSLANAGECRRHVPVISPSTIPSSLWPEVKAADWCGEFEAEAISEIGCAQHPPKGKQENDNQWKRFAQLEFSCLLKEATAMDVERPAINRTLDNVTFRAPGPVAIIKLAMKPDPQNPYEPKKGPRIQQRPIDSKNEWE